MNKFFFISFLTLLIGIRYLYASQNDFQQTVSAGIYLIHVSNIDVKSQTFKAEFYLNFKWKGNRSAKNFELINATEFSQYFLTEWEEGGYNYLACKIRGTFRSKMNVSRFPFDSQNLEIVIGDFVWIEDSLKYTINDTLTGFSKGINILDWTEKKYSLRVNTLDEMGSRYSVLIFNFLVQRKYAFFFIKILIPLIIVLLVALLDLFIPKNELDACIGLGITSLLSMIALHYSIAGQLPDVSYPTRVDLLMIGSYFLVFLSMVEIVFVFNMLQRNKIIIANKVEKFSRWMIPLAYITFLLILFIE